MDKTGRNSINFSLTLVSTRIKVQDKQQCVHVSLGIYKPTVQAESRNTSNLSLNNNNLTDRLQPMDLSTIQAISLRSPLQPTHHQMPMHRPRIWLPFVPPKLSQVVAGSCCRTHMPLKEGQVLKQIRSCYLTGIGQLVGGSLLAELTGEHRKHRSLGSKTDNGTRLREYCSLKNLDKIGNGDMSKRCFQEENYEATAVGVLGKRIAGGMADDNRKFRVYATEGEGNRVKGNRQ